MPTQHAKLFYSFFFLYSDLIFLTRCNIGVVGITIGLEDTRFEVNEENVDVPSDDFVEVCASIMSGSLETDVVALLNTMDGTAIGMYICVCMCVCVCE